MASITTSTRGPSTALSATVTGAPLFVPIANQTPQFHMGPTVHRDIENATECVDTRCFDGGMSRLGEGFPAPTAYVQWCQHRSFDLHVLDDGEK